MRLSLRAFILYGSLLLLAWLPDSLAAQVREESPGALDELISLNLPGDIELDLLITLVSDQLGLKILLDERVGKQRITLKAPGKVPRSSLRGVLESALKMKGLALIETPGSTWLRIEDAKDLTRVAGRARREGTPLPEGARPTLAVTEIFTLKHVDPQRLEPVVKQFLTQPGGNLLSAPGERLLIVTDYLENMPRLRELIELLDSERVPAEVAFLDAEHLPAEDAAKELKDLLLAKKKAEGGPQTSRLSLEILVDKRLNRLVLLGTREEIEEARTLARSIDTPLGLKTEIYRFSTASPTTVDQLTRDLIGPLNERLYRAAMYEDSGILVVTTTVEIHKQVEALRLDLDSKLRESEPEVKFYKLKNATAAEVLSTIRQIKGDTYSLSRPPTTLAGIPAQITGPLGGNPAPQTGGRTRNSSASPEREPSPLQQTRPQSSSFDAGAARVVADVLNNTIVVIASSEEQRSYGELIERLDRLRPQVLIEILVVALDTSGSFSIGVEIAGLGDGPNHRVLTFSSFGLSEIDQATGNLEIIPGTGFNGSVISQNYVDAVVRALATSGRAEVQSAPKILVSDNATGTLNSVAEAPYTSVNASTTVATTSFGGFESAGTTITVTPHISEGDHLRLEYSVTLSTFTGSGGGGIPPPRQRNELQSEVTIPDGHTIIVGGLTRKDFGETITKVPILGDIPLLGYLFSSRSLNESTSTLFLFIRPVILRDDRFEDLKYLSEVDTKAARLDGDFPLSAPILIP